MIDRCSGGAKACPRVRASGRREVLKGSEAARPPLDVNGRKNIIAD